MTTTEVYLDPSDESDVVTRKISRRPSAISGTVGLLDISKARGNVFLDRLEGILRDRGLDVKRFRKPTFTKPAPMDLRREIREKCEVVIEALAD